MKQAGKKIQKTGSAVRRLPSEADERQIARWATTQDVFDRIEEGVSEVLEDHADLDALLERSVFEENTTQLNMRVPPAMKALLTRLARRRTTDATTLARIWLAERLRRELGADR
ncbi:MAG: hypothetical protein HY744_24840 [Deltaproteobacteria bacterium]|nr:hypothetical protein [Deltaproteobacteria bacterium]